MKPRSKANQHYLRRRPLNQAITAALLALGASGQTIALPVDGQVTVGVGAITTTANTVTVTQSSSKLALNWQSFNVGATERVNFIQPSSNAIALNRVVGADASKILGILSANGQVFLVNPNGVVFGSGAQVDVGGLVASTLNISDADFAEGNYRFNGNGNSAQVINRGNLRAKDGGYLVLLAAQAQNTGSMTATHGNVALGAGNKATLDLMGNGLLAIRIDDAAVAAQVANHGVIQANGGQVILTAKAAGNVLHTVVNNTGVIEALSVTERNGVIRLEGGPSGIVANHGRLDVSGKRPNETGGSIKVLGDKVALHANAVLDASGDAGGGTVLVGGNYRGQGFEQNATATYVDAQARINADAISRGNGGKVIVWANDSTRFHGAITARAGKTSGDGGFVETSGKNYLEAYGTVDASAVSGKAGRWLLDPRNVTITSVTTNGTFSGTDPDVFTPTADNSTVLNTTINLALDAGISVTITTGVPGSQAGNITVASDINKVSGTDATLTLQAANDIIVNNGVQITSTANRLNIVFNADHDGSASGAIVMNPGSRINTNGGYIVFGGGSGNPQLSGAAAGNGVNTYGIHLNNSRLIAGAGDITLRGAGLAGGSGSYGIHMTGGAYVQTTSGTISVNGVGGFGTQFNHGVNIAGAGTTISTDTGAINIVGQGSGTGNANYGIAVSTGALVESTGNGAITLTGTGAAGIDNNIGIVLADTNTRITSVNGNIAMAGQGAGSGVDNHAVSLSNNGLVRSTGTANITIQGNGTGMYRNLALNAAIDAGNGNLLLNTAGTASQTAAGSITANRLALLGGGAHILTAGNNQIATLAGNAGSIGFREADGFNIGTVNGTVGLNASTLDLRAATGTLTQSDALTVSGNSVFTADAAGASIALTHAANDFGGSVAFRGSGGLANVSIADATALDLGASTLSGNLAVTAGGAITQSGALTVGGTTSVGAGPANNVMLNNASNEFVGTVSIASGNNVILRDANAFTLGSSSISGGLIVAASGPITQTGTLTVGGNASLIAAETIRLGGPIASANFTAVSNGGDIVLNSSASINTGGTGNAVVLAGINFINHAGANAISTPSGRWLIYSTNPASNTNGGLISGSDPLWNRTYANYSPGNVTETGNRYLYSTAFASVPVIPDSSTLPVNPAPSDQSWFPTAPQATASVMPIITVPRAYRFEFPSAPVTDTATGRSAVQIVQPNSEGNVVGTAREMSNADIAGSLQGEHARLPESGAPSAGIPFKTTQGVQTLTSAPSLPLLNAFHSVATAVFSKAKNVGNMSLSGALLATEAAEMFTLSRELTKTWLALDLLKEKAEAHYAKRREVILVVTGGALIFSAGYLIWLLAGGTLASLALALLPLWGSFDPLPVLARAKRKLKDEPASAEELAAEERIGRLMGSKNVATRNASQR
jgi:filamentous hemagglutinin family protein